MDKTVQTRIVASLMTGAPALLVGCGAPASPMTAFDECQQEITLTGIELNCEDDESDWYKKKKYKSKSAVSAVSAAAAYKSSSSSVKSGFGGSKGFFSGG
jgi:hypothetical protein